MAAKAPATLAHVVFQKDGRKTLVREQLPTDKGSLEQRIAEKFVHCLRRLGRPIGDPDSTLSGPHDSHCPGADGGHTLQLTEVVIPRIAQVHAQRLQYTSAIRQKLDSIAGSLLGVHLQLSLTDGEPLWPTPESSRGRAIVDRFLVEVQAELSEIAALEPGYFHTHFWTLDGFRCGILSERYRAELAKAPPLISGPGGSSCYQRDRQRSLPVAVLKKIKKNYAAATTSRLVLVAYQIHGGGIAHETQEPEPYLRARRLLQRYSHPFDEVWYFSPQAGELQGCAPVQLWPPPKMGETKKPVTQPAQASPFS